MWWSRKPTSQRTRCARKDGREQCYSLGVAGGPRQPLGLLHDHDGSRRVVRRALHLVRGQSQELRSVVRVFQRQIGAPGVITVGAPGHHASHKISHRRLHPRQHDPAWVLGDAFAWVRRRPTGAPHGDAVCRRVKQIRRKWIVIQLDSRSMNTEIETHKRWERAARWSCDKPVAAGGFGPAGWFLSSLQGCRSKVPNRGAAFTSRAQRSCH